MFQIITPTVSIRYGQTYLQTFCCFCSGFRLNYDSSNLLMLDAKFMWNCCNLIGISIRAICIPDAVCAREIVSIYMLSIAWIHKCINTTVATAIPLFTLKLISEVAINNNVWLVQMVHVINQCESNLFMNILIEYFKLVTFTEFDVPFQLNWNDCAIH